MIFLILGDSKVEKSLEKEKVIAGKSLSPCPRNMQHIEYAPTKASEALLKFLSESLVKSSLDNSFLFVPLSQNRCPL